MKSVKLKFVDYWNGFVPENYFLWDAIIQAGFQPVLDENPDYLIFGPFGHENLKYTNCVKIFFTGENIVPDFNICDYAIGFEWMEYGDRYLRYPLYYKYYDDYKLCAIKHLLLEDDFVTKNEFCSFVYSNKSPDPMRDSIFEAINGYRKVNSGGRHLNNIGMPNGVPDKLLFQKKHKFSIACENSSHSGYVTEKLVQCFAAKTVPIYWGAPDIGKEFNKKSFINVMDYSSLDELVDYIKYVDTHDEEYRKILSEPAFIVDQSEQIHQKLYSFLESIFIQPISSAKRRTMCAWGANYQKTLQMLWEDHEMVEEYNCFKNSKVGRLLAGISDLKGNG